MSCTDNILSIDALIQRAVRYSSGCAALKYAEEAEEGALTCDAEIPDLVLLAMAFDSDANVFRVAITNVALADLCNEYELKIACDGVTASQALRDAFTVTPEDGVATIRVLYVTDADGSCNTTCGERQLAEMVGATAVTDGTDTYILAMAPDEEPDELDCVTAEVGAETFTRAALAPVGSCDMWAWRISVGDLEDLGAFDSGFNNGFDIAT